MKRVVEKLFKHDKEKNWNEMHDIESREDIVILVDSFYIRVLQDKVIGYLFTDIAKINMDEHMPKMYDFWETTLFHKSIYKGNPMTVHLHLNKKEALKKQHFDRWLLLFSKTVDELFIGNNAELAKTRALSIATIMQVKIHQSHN